MKNLFKNAVILLVTIAVLAACGRTTESKCKADKGKTQDKKLSVDEKAKNIFANTIVIFSGSMMLAFSDVFRGEAEAFAQIFDSELDEDAVKELDQKIAGLNDDNMSKLMEMKVTIDHAYDSIAKVNRTVYEKMFLRESMKEGVAIAESCTLPVGFRPLTQELSKDEIKRYIVKVMVDGQDTSDMVTKYLTEIMMWLQETGKELESDQEIKAFMESMKK